MSPLRSVTARKISEKATYQEGKGCRAKRGRKFYVPRREKAPHEVRSGVTYRTVPRFTWQQNLRTETGKGIALRYRIEYRAGSNNIPLKSLWYVEFSTELRAPVSSFLVRSSRRRDCSLKPWYVAIFRDVLLPSWYVGT